DPPILILDEATSALDTETEAIIQDALLELSKDRTTLIIAHRLATVKHADKIMVVTKEGIEEEGTHDELIAQKGIFANWHDVQLGNVKSVEKMIKVKPQISLMVSLYPNLSFSE